MSIPPGGAITPFNFLGPVAAVVNTTVNSATSAVGTVTSGFLGTVEKTVEKSVENAVENFTAPMRHLFAQTLPAPNPGPATMQFAEGGLLTSAGSGAAGSGTSLTGSVPASQATSILTQVESDVFHRVIASLLHEVESQPLWRTYSNTITAAWTGLIVLAGWITTTDLSLPRWAVIAIGAILYVAGVFGIKATPNGVSASTVATVLKLPMSPMAPAQVFKASGTWTKPANVPKPPTAT